MARLESNGINDSIVEHLSKSKYEPVWMLQKRKAALALFKKSELPTWGVDLSAIDFENITYFSEPNSAPKKSWDDVPTDIRKTFDAIGVPKAEYDFLAGVGAQFNSGTVYHNLKQALANQGVIFCDIDTALQEREDLVRQYFGTLVPPTNNMFAALNSAAWSGGTFLYVPPHVHVELPLQAYFFINAKRFGQFERTLIIVDEGASVHYVEGCTAPTYTSDSLHAGVVEVFAKKGARIRYTTIQNWPTNVYNLTTKRAIADESAAVEWIDCNIGSKATMKYPSVVLKGRGSTTNILGISLAGANQQQDTGCKAIHLAPNTTSTILQKSISRDGGVANFRGLVDVRATANNVVSNVRCDALLLDNRSQSNTYPKFDIQASNASIAHEASVGKVSDEQLFYLQSRGLSYNNALSMIINGFIEPVVKEIPVEYAAELNRLIQLEIEPKINRI